MRLASRNYSGSSQNRPLDCLLSCLSLLVTKVPKGLLFLVNNIEEVEKENGQGQIRFTLSPHAE